MPSAPHLGRWHQAYAKKGLTIVVNFGDDEEKLDKVKALVKEKEMTWPVLFDKGSRNNKAFGITSQPYAYLVGVEGKVIWEGMLVRNREELEKVVAAEVEKVK